MSDDLNKKIKQITDILGQENLPDNVKGLLTLLGGENKQNEKEVPKDPHPEPIINENRSSNEMQENIEMLSRAKKIFDKLNTKDDPRINLLYSMKPFLNNNRQKKLANCIKLLQMYNLSKLVDDTDKSLL